jgi:hypothetical protein
MVNDLALVLVHRVRARRIHSLTRYRRARVGSGRQ